MRRIVSLFLVWSLWSAIGQAQDPSVFETVLDARTITENDYLVVEFTLYKEGGKDFQPPNLEDFIIQSGPNPSSWHSVINGRSSYRFSFQYTLLPKRVGRLRIGSASIKIKGKTYKTEAVRIEVVKASTGDGSPEVILQMNPSAHTIWLGQQVNLDYTVYSKSPLKDHNILKSPPFPDQSEFDLQRFDTRTYREVQDGQTFYRRTLRRKALFPQRSGPIIIDTLMVQVGLQENRWPGPQFDIAPLRYLLVKSDTVRLYVRSLPPNAPAGYTGAVGQFRGEVSANTDVLSSDDAFELTIAIQGNGDIKRVFAPDLNLPSGIEVYDKKVLEERAFDLNGELIGRKVFRYVLLPRKQGKVAFSPSLYYFNTDSAAYLPLYQDTLRFYVNPGDQGQLSSQPEESVSLPSRLPLKLDTRLVKPAPPFVGSPGFWILILSPFLIGLGIIAWLEWKKREAGKAVQYSGSKAKRLFLKDIQGIDIKVSGSLEQLSRSWNTYLSRELKLPESSSKGVLLTHLKELSTPEKVAQAKLIFEKLDLLKFAGSGSDNGLDTLRQHMIDWVNE